MILVAFAALLASAPISRLSDPELDQKLGEIHRAPAIGDRIEAVSKLFLGLPYVEFPLGEGDQGGPEPQMRWRLDGVDCQTFVETVLALVNAKSTGEAKALLDDIRYSKPPISFQTRSHFTEAQWLPANVEKGYLRDEVPSIDGRAPTTELVLNKRDWGRVRGLQRLIPADIPEGKFAIRYLPLGQTKKRAGSIEPGSIILVVREPDPTKVVRVSHMGFVLRGPKGLIVRHASTNEHAVVDEEFNDYLDRMAGYKKWKVSGFGLAMPLDAKLRAAQIARQ